jgi:putative transposase
MSVRKVSFAQGEFYHLYNRGNSKQEIFHDKEDYLRFITLLYTCNSVNNFRIFLYNQSQVLNPYNFDRGGAIVSIGAYVLMPNHFHILITEERDGGISKFMQKISTAYSMYYNKKYNHSGGLFEGKFKSKHLNEDRYLKYSFSYIHLNPVKLIDKHWKEKGIVNKKLAIDYLNKYEYSSYLDYIGTKRIQNSILNIKEYPDYFPSKESFKSEIFDWLSYRE